MITLGSEFLHSIIRLRYQSAHYDKCNRKIRIFIICKFFIVLYKFLNITTTSNTDDDHI